MGRAAGDEMVPEGMLEKRWGQLSSESKEKRGLSVAQRDQGHKWAMQQEPGLGLQGNRGSQGDLTQGDKAGR